jgi:uncharacterized membrane protein
MEENVRNFFTKEQKEVIIRAVKNAELNTSGEIRVHIENTCKGEALHRAAAIFEKLGMTKTAQRNGVLFYLAVRDKKFAIAGDYGIDEKVSASFWESLKMKMLIHFREGRFTDGLVEGIELTGLELKKYFPYQSDDINELPDDISFGK